MSGELEPSGQSPAETDIEFGEPAGGIEDIPQFIILGYGGGTLVWSTDVECTQMVRRIDGFDLVPLRAGPHAPVARVPRWVIAIGAKLRSFEQHIGEDYGSALSTLLTDLQRRQQADPPPSALPPGG